jgi:phage shock protein PspC (stress-responsive transcriptional regulator)
MTKRLTRTKTGAILGGVCAGIGNFLNIDPVFVRIFFILFMVTGGFGIFVYLILWLVMPREDKLQAEAASSGKPDEIGDRAKLMGEEIKDAASKPNPRLPLYIGIGLIVLGGFTLLKAFVPSTNAIIWPIMLVMGGIVLLIFGTKGG